MSFGAALQALKLTFSSLYFQFHSLLTNLLIPSPIPIGVTTAAADLKVCLGDRKTTHGSIAHEIFSNGLNSRQGFRNGWPQLAGLARL